MKRLVLIGLMFVNCSPALYAATAEEKGLEIAQKVDEYDRGWGDVSASLSMLLRNQQGEESQREIHIKLLEVDGDGDKGLTVFDGPSDVKGSAFLSYSHATEPDQQWLYLPALKRVKRISSANKSGPFMGSQFAFEDLSSFEVEKYDYKYLRNEAWEGRDTFVVENYPKYKYSGYTRQLVWIDQQRYIPLKVQYFDRKNDLLKTLLFSDYQQYQGQYWRASKQRMENHQNGKVTLLSLNDYQFGNGFTEGEFERNSLKRAR